MVEQHWARARLTDATDDLNVRQLGQRWFGEMPLPEAPTCTLGEVPQQYLQYRRDKAVLEAIVSCCQYDDNHPLFVGDDDGLYVQVGLIGHDNYRNREVPKIVYGRRWLIEAHTPTSEVVQTCFLALQKAREHELREFVTMMHRGNTTTPFNCHFDLPLMVQHQHQFPPATPGIVSLDTVNALLQSLRIGRLACEAQSLTTIGRHLAIEITLQGECATFPELSDSDFVITTTEYDPAHILHQLFAGLLRLTNEAVAERFEFLGFARFSQRLHPQDLAAFSANTRRVHAKSEPFNRAFASMNQAVDSQHAPLQSTGALVDRDAATFTPQLTGYWPRRSRES